MTPEFAAVVLQGVIQSNLEERRQAAERAKRMIGDEVVSFERWVQSQEVTPLIVSLRETLLGVGEFELGFHNLLDATELSWTAQQGIADYQLLRSTLTDFSEDCEAFCTILGVMKMIWFSCE